MVWQRAGTVSVQNGSTTVTGAGVDFAASSRVGDSFVGPDGATYEVANVASGTVISILPAYRGATVSGASYAIMPVQGYDKMLSDAFNNLNNQFGPKLAALGTTGNYEILPVLKGGTGNDTGTAMKLAASAMVGTVSQSSGVPTGALIQNITNANGIAIRFADGTQIALRIVGPHSVGPGVSQANGPYDFAASFISTPFISANTQSSWSGYMNINLEGSSGGTTKSSYVYSIFNRHPSVTVSDVFSMIIAVGRWF